ncbi:MAG: magnesium transporter [Alphaproteobacteria bacterium]|nr:magnesium transporter [Alphaproteobacteria bacterium]
MNDAPEHDTPAGAPDSQQPDIPGVIAPAMIEQFEEAVESGDRDFLKRTISELHPADAADLLEHLPLDEFRRAINLVDADLPPEAVAELGEDTRIAALGELSDDGIAAMVENLESDDASFLLNDLSDERRTRILARMPATDRAAIESSLAFDEESAGRLMQRDFVAAPIFWTVGQAIDHMRTVDDDDLPDTFFDIYIVDPGFRLQGAVPVSTLLRSTRETPLKDLMKESRVKLTTGMDQEEVAYLFQQYNLASAPVVDEAGRLTGMITVDDVVDVIQEEAQEDMLALSGVSESGVNQSIFSAVRARVPWLAINLFTAFIASTVVSLFSNVINHFVTLAFLMPVVAGVSGNCGSQSLAVAVRAIAERDMEGSMVMRAIRREAATALINGLLIAWSAALVSLILFHAPVISLVVGMAMTLTFTWAGLIGILAPLTLKRLGQDPAVSSSVFVLTSIDMISFFVFLGLSTLILL